MEKFGYSQLRIDRALIRSRISSTCSALGWKVLVEKIMRARIPFNDLSVAEVGCGTGTFSLTLNMLGARTCLLDADEGALAATKQVFSLYKCEAAFIKADVLKPVPSGLSGRFDIVISGGLAEHFIGEERLQCISYHRSLLRDDGCAYIGVPNRLSTCYQIVRKFKELTGTWHIRLEKPFTYWELLRLAERAGFWVSEIIGNNPISKDCRDYSLGLLSAVLDVLPTRIRENLRRARSKRLAVVTDGTACTGKEEERIIANAVEQLKMQRSVTERRHLKDYLSAGIVLFGYTGTRFHEKN